VVNSECLGCAGRKTERVNDFVPVINCGEMKKSEPSAANSYFLFLAPFLKISVTHKRDLKSFSLSE